MLKLCFDSIYEPASTSFSPGFQASRNELKCMSLRRVSPYCSQTVMKPKLKNMPNKAPTPQARCGSYVIFFLQEELSLQVILYSKIRNLKSLLDGIHQGLGRNKRWEMLWPSGKWLWLAGVLCSWKMETPAVHRGNVQLWACRRWELLASLRSSTWFISSLVGKKFWHAFLERLLGLDLLWPDLIEDFAKLIIWDVLWQHWVNKAGWSQIIIYTYTERNIKIALKKNISLSLTYNNLPLVTCHRPQD